MRQALVLVALVAGCAGSTPGQSSSAAEVEKACRAAVAELAAAHEAGVLSCEQAKARVLADNPACQLRFTCKDGGQ